METVNEQYRIKGDRQTVSSMDKTNIVSLNCHETTKTNSGGNRYY